MSKRRAGQPKAAKVRRHCPFAPDAEITIGRYFRNQPSTEEPDTYIALEAAKQLRDQGLGCFINHGTAFRDFRSSLPKPQPGHKPATGRNTSCHIEGGEMQRFVIASMTGTDPEIIMAVQSWA